MSTVDLPLAGSLRLRLVDADERHIRAACWQLGAATTTADGEADLTIAYVDRLPSADLRLLGTDAGWTNYAFVVRRGRGLATMPLDEVGASGMAITCERSIGLPPQLVPMINVTLLARGVLQLHASAVTFEGRGIAFAGWSKGGKTEALLAMLELGAEGVADEWLAIEPATRQMRTIPEPIRLEAAHLAQLPHRRAGIGRGRRGRIAVAGGTRRLLDAFGAVRWTHRLVGPVESQRHVDLAAERVAPGISSRVAQLDEVVLVMAGEDPQITVGEVDREVLVERMVAAHMHHRQGLMALYRTFRFAFPERASVVLDTLEDRERSLLERALPPGPSRSVTHPHPVPIQALGTTLRDLLSPTA
jgi:hypothetical protein